MTKALAVASSQEGNLFLMCSVMDYGVQFLHVSRFRSAKITDQRIRIMNEVIVGIRVIKMYAWEYAFKRVVEQLRK